MPAATLDPRGVRFTAAMTSVILALGLVTASWRVLAAQMVLFGMCAFLGMRLNPWGYVFRQAVRPRLAPIDPAEREEPAPVRFSQGVGFAFALVATVGYAAEWTTLGLVANAFALVAALLNAVFGYCLGCQMYLLLRRVTPVGASASDTR
ncbi:protein of unknown function [Saccharopolyspora shandongensis]|uniref:DUF4395 domain-containing protein n=1 Tax=Saccharopolyspora shandongensis TaxID=418495 RepID=A0A1H2YXY0_9PSEU|nr:DUF4395 domain-containing protein [Saccharopolyspora shandongensis]SDX09915.1 protein of unknown function [Saccharopolyspora shandongensis]